MKTFGSDNHSGASPEVIRAIEKANTQKVIAYGEDTFTEDAILKFKKQFGNNIDVFIVLNGTGANTLSLKACTSPFNSIICAETAHINSDECGAPENYTGCKLKTLFTVDGKLTVDLIQKALKGRGDQHHSQPKVVSITQTTELGTVYTPDEVKTIADFVHSKNMFLHMDGARLCNAAAFLKCSLKEITNDCHVDILSFGGTKNGMIMGESIVVFNKQLAENLMYIRKQGMQLASKMRFLSAQFCAFFENDLWIKNANNANKMACYLRDKIKDIKEIEILFPVESNGVFARLSKSLIDELQKKYFFYVWNEDFGDVRWMACFDTTKEEIDEFVLDIEKTIIELKGN